MDDFNTMMYGRRRGFSGIKGGKNNFTKRDIVKYMAEQSGLSQKVCTAALNEAVGFIKLYSSDTDSCVTIAGFGSFRTKEYAYNSKLHGRTYKGKRKKLVFTPSGR